MKGQCRPLRHNEIRRRPRPRKQGGGKNIAAKPAAERDHGRQALSARTRLPIIAMAIDETTLGGDGEMQRAKPRRNTRAAGTNAQ